MITVARSPREPETRQHEYQPSPQARFFGITAVLLLHLAFIATLLSRGAGSSELPGRDGGGSGELAVFALRPVAATRDAPRKGGGDEARVPAPKTVPANQKTEAIRAGSGNLDDHGAADLGDELAQLLADDPVSGGGKASYETILRRHISAHSRAPADRRGRRLTGMVIVRFRVERDGQIVDARVLRSRGAKLDEAALATLWRSEPLPSVPDHYSAPLEVDMPIDFQMSS